MGGPGQFGPRGGAGHVQCDRPLRHVVSPRPGCETPGRRPWDHVCPRVCRAARPPGAGVAPRPRPRGCERPRGDGADLERVAARLSGRLTTTPVTCRRRGSLSVACHRGAPIPEGTRRQSRAGVTPARWSPDSGSPGASLSRLLVRAGLSGHGRSGRVFTTARERSGVGSVGACGSLATAPGAEGPSAPTERSPTGPTRPRASRLSRPDVVRTHCQGSLFQSSHGPDGDQAVLWELH